MSDVVGPFGGGVIFAGGCEDTEMAVARGREGEAGLRLQRMRVCGEVMFGAAVAFGLRMKISVFDVEAHRQSHVGFGRELFAETA